MNRWWGNKQDSANQAAERSQRAARRTIRELNLNVLSDEDDFQDANSTLDNVAFANLNLDGGHSQASSVVGSDEEVDSVNMPLTDAQLAVERAKTVQEANYPDDSEAWKKELKLKFDRHDVLYWINASESDMKKFGINSQWSKKNAIVSMLPPDIVEELKPILRLSEEDQGPHIYKDLRQELLSLFGPRDEDAFKKAIALRLTGRPSALGKDLPI